MKYLSITNIVIISIVLILIYYLFFNNYKEGYTNKYKLRCPNVLIERDGKFYLQNTKLAQVPGVNPIMFNNLEDYVEFIQWQRRNGIRCPVLYLQQTYDAQGKPVYKTRPDPLNPQGGLQPSSDMPISIASSGEIIMETPKGNFELSYPNPTLLVDAGRNDPPYNKNGYPGFDSSSFYVGSTTPLDVMNIAEEASPVSSDAMMSNWGGEEFTRNLVKNDFFEDNEVHFYR